MPEQRIVYRPMTQADLGAAAYIRKSALDWLARSEGRDPNPWHARAPHHLAHILTTDAGGSWVAEIEGLVVGFSQAIVRGNIWFLAQLFVQPEVHAHGAGRDLLSRAKAYGATRDATIYSVISSTSPVAQSLYMREGMFAMGIGYAIAGRVDALLRLPEADATKKKIVDCAGWQDRIAALDLEVFGAERRADHALMFASVPSSPWARTSFGLNRDGELAGYGYADDVDGTGWIAPIAAYDPADQVPLVRMAGDWLAQREIDGASMWVLSQNATLLAALLGVGWRINRWSFFLANQAFGKFDRYHPFNGILL
jgi:GNAT superfamily N-acetyltransferase